MIYSYILILLNCQIHMFKIIILKFYQRINISYRFSSKNWNNIDIIDIIELYNECDWQKMIHIYCMRIRNIYINRSITKKRMSFFNMNTMGFRRVYYDNWSSQAQTNCCDSLRSLDSSYLSKELLQASVLRGNR